MKYRVTIHYNGQLYIVTFKTIKQAEKFLIYFDTKKLLNTWTLYLTDITIDRVYKMDKGGRDYAE